MKVAKLKNSKYAAETKMTYAELMLSYAFEYGVDFQKRIIRITQEIDEGHFEIIDAAMTQMEAESRKAITIKIHTFGGSIYEANAIVGRMLRSSCKVNTEGYGAIMSAGTIIFAAGESRKISSFATFMWHEVSFSLGGYARQTTVEAESKIIKKEFKRWVDFMVTKSNKDANYWLAKSKHIDHYLFPDELVEIGLAHEVI